VSLWTDTGNARPRFGAARNGPGHLEAVEQVKEWTRGRFALREDEVVLVAESASSLPGYPPVETGVAFRTTDGTRHHFKLFKGVEEVVEDDLPPAWMKAALAASDGFGCECC
jgi:hypothetical protein